MSATKRKYVRGEYGPLGRLIAERLKELNDTYPSLRLSLIGLANSVPMYRPPRGKKGQTVEGSTEKFRDAQWLNAVMKSDQGVRSVHKLEYDALFRILSTKTKPSTATRRNQADKRPSEFTVVDPVPDMADVDENEYLRLALTVLDKQDLASHYMRALTFPDVQRLQNDLSQAEVWVFTTTMGESQDPAIATRTVDGILKGNKYRFFVPFNDENWRRALERIQADLANRSLTTTPDLNEHLKIFGISMLMVHSLTLLNPTEREKKAFISMGGWRAEVVQFLPIDPVRVESTVQKYVDVYQEGLECKNPTDDQQPFDQRTLPQSGISVKRFFPR